MAEDAPLFWQAVGPDRVIFAHWEADYSVFNGNTGETHLLSELPAEVLRQLSEVPMTGEALATNLAKLCEVEETPDWACKVADILKDLADLDLVELVAS
jgi:PqqD family protein of HPr-rel-A system